MTTRILPFPPLSIPASQATAEAGFTLVDDPAYNERRSLLSAAWDAVVAGEDDDVFVQLLEASTLQHRCRLAAEIAMTDAQVDLNLMAILSTYVPRGTPRACERAFGEVTRSADLWLALACCEEIEDPEKVWLILLRNGRADFRRARDSRYYISPDLDQLFIIRLAEDRDVKRRTCLPSEDVIIECANITRAGQTIARSILAK